MNGIEMIAELMAISAVTAPKTKGMNFIQTKVLTGDMLQKIAADMLAYGEKIGKKGFARDSKNVADSEAVLLIGVKDADVADLDCQACGFSSCNELEGWEKTDNEFVGPICAFRLLDMGIALGSAVKTAAIHNVDNRIMYRIGVAARNMGVVDWDFVMGIPLSVSGKNIFFDR